MTGPIYPAPDPLSNSIGRFTIGVSPIGSQPLWDVWETIQSQYANSPIITTLIQNFADFIDQTQNFDAFFDLIMNVDTAVGYGLDVWGRIVGVNRVITIITPNPYFGFQESAEAVGFNQAPFFSGQSITTNYILNDQAYRTLILTKAFANISQDSIPKLNQMLMTLFPHRGNAYVTEGQAQGPWFGFKEATDATGFDQAPFYAGQIIVRMIMTYTFEFTLSPLEMAIVKNSGVLPKPTGVKAYVLDGVQPPLPPPPPPSAGGELDFSDPSNSGLMPALTGF